jgi:hypothetical protein
MKLSVPLGPKPRPGDEGTDFGQWNPFDGGWQVGGYCLWNRKQQLEVLAIAQRMVDRLAS